MPRHILAFAVLAVVLAAVFARLGFWQLDRRAERRALNVVASARLEQSEVAFAALPRDSTAERRRVVVRGVPDTAYEFWLTGRSRNGSPGVHIITPLRVVGSDTAVLVNRGWVYAADAATADLSPWREARDEYHGYAMVLAPGATAPGIKGRALRSWTLDGVRHLVPYPVHAAYVVAQDSAANTPARLPMPALDEGPHLNYAIQWFCFALIAVGGAGIVVARARVSRDA